MLFRSNPNKQILDKPELLEYLKNIENNILLTIGAGDIGLLADKIESILKQR